MADMINESDSDLTSECGDDEVERDREKLLALNPFALKNFSKTKTHYMAEFDVEKWVLELDGFTAPTAISMITWAEGMALQHYYQEACCGHKAKITPDDRSAIEHLRGKISTLIGELVSKCHTESGFFVRLGSRSPKDAPMYLCAPWGLSEERVCAAVTLAVSDVRIGDEGVECDGNAHALLQRFQKACYSLLRVRNAEDAISLLVSSSRVMQDVSHTMDHGECNWNMSLALRSWDEHVSLDREFRTFVVGGEVAAITQYDDQLCYSFVLDNSEKIVKAILRCLSNIKPNLANLGLASASMAVVIDFLVVPEEAEGDGDSCQWSARVVELNPFGPVTGAGLFTWTADRRVLQGGKDLYGDLEDVERLHAPGGVPLPTFASEKVIEGIPFRYVTTNPPNYTWEHLKAFWPDYLRLALPVLSCKQR